MDIVIGVPFEDRGANVDVGAVNIIYGSAAGLQITAPLDQYWTQNSASVREVSEGGDSLGVLSSFSSLTHPVP